MDLDEESPSFCKVLFRDFSDHLLVPPAFVKHLDRTPANIILQVPDNGAWPVDVEVVKEDVLFQNGWSSFARDNSLERGDFLTFSYAGSSKFIVTIYGRSGCLKDLPLATKKRCEPPTCQENQEEEEELPKNGDRRSSSPFFDSHKRKKTKVHAGSRGSNSGSKLVGTFTQPRRKSEQIRKKLNEPSKRNFKTEQRNMSKASRGPLLIHKASVSKVNVETQKEVRGAAAASKFNSEFPFFKITMHPTYVKNYNLSLPVSFCQMYMEDVANVTLWVSDKSWPVKMYNYTDNAAKFYGGWSTFVKENNVKAGDVCAFELIERNNADVEFRVSIFRCPSNS